MNGDESSPGRHGVVRGFFGFLLIFLAEYGIVLPRRAARRDNNEQLIVQMLRGVGASVSRLSDKGLPDLLVGYRGRNHLLEVKQKSKLTPSQKEWADKWRGSYSVVHSVDEALAAIGAVHQ